ncbi:MAG: hypothetical protein PUJ57_02540 [Peptoniphilaceae bacterium]|nr:hypothetical protein [Peptoniphilaceae bacterium]MDY6086234.1 hypothetical protein [Peptoniphilaceae bacterium]
MDNEQINKMNEEAMKDNNDVMNKNNRNDDFERTNVVDAEHPLEEHDAEDKEGEKKTKEMEELQGAED